MPAHVFELLYIYYMLKGQTGKPPSVSAVAKALQIDFCTALQRRDRAVESGIIVKPPPCHRGLEWAVLTDRGAEMFVAVMDGTEEAPAKPGTLLSFDRDLFPDSVRYVYLPTPEYQAYVKELAENAGRSALES